MPNHVTHHVRARGPMEALQELLTCFDGRTLDFERIIPMPELLKDSSSPNETALAVYRYRTEGRPPTELLPHLGYRWVREAGAESLEDVVALLERRDADARKTRDVLAVACQAAGLKPPEPTAERLALFQEGERAAQALRETGYANWYDWSVANWGTKWNAYEGHLTEEAGEVIFGFDCAWSFPEPVFEALGERFGALIFRGEWFDEGWMHAGTFRVAGVLETTPFEPRTHDAHSHEVYERVYGNPPVFEEEEEAS